MVGTKLAGVRVLAVVADKLRLYTSDGEDVLEAAGPDHSHHPLLAL